MCSYKRIAVTASKLAQLPLPEQIRKAAKLHKIDMLILREKELTEEEYEALALEVLKVCKEEGITCVLHSFVRVAEKLGVKNAVIPNMIAATINLPAICPIVPIVEELLNCVLELLSMSKPPY